MKRSLVVLLMAALFVSALAGCGKTTENTDIPALSSEGISGSTQSGNDAASESEDNQDSSSQLIVPLGELTPYADVKLETKNEKTVLYVGGELYRTFQDTAIENNGAYISVSFFDAEENLYYELELHQYSDRSIQAFRYDYINEIYDEFMDGEVMDDGYSFPLDESVYSPDMLSAVSVNIAVYDRGWLYEENIALWCQDGVLKLDSGRGIPTLATLPEITPEPNTPSEEKPNLSIYSVDDEETWFVIEGEDAAEFISNINKGIEAELRIEFEKMLDENGGEVVSWIDLNWYGKASYSASIWNKAVEGYSIDTDGKYFRMHINTDMNIVALYLNAKEYVKNKLADESIVSEYKEKLRNVENNVTLFDGSERCLITHDSIYDDCEPWDLADIWVNEGYSFPIQYQIFKDDIYNDGYVSYEQDTEYFSPMSDDYLLRGWGDYSRVYLISFGEDGAVIDARMRSYTPGTAEQTSAEENAEELYRDENVVYSKFDVTKLNDTSSLYEIADGRIDALYYMLREKEVSDKSWMYMSKPEPTQEDLAVNGIVLIENPDSYLLDAERLSEDYIVHIGTYAPNDGVVQYPETPRILINFYDTKTHLVIGGIKYYTFESEAIASQFHTNIDNPNASVIGNRVYIKTLYSSNDITSWNYDTETLLYNIGDSNQTYKILWSRNCQTIEEFLAHPLHMYIN